MKRALVTGATGYVGSNLVRRLIREGWNVGVIVRPSSSMQQLSGVHDKIGVYKITDATDCMLDIVGESKPDVVFHVASMVVNEHTHDEVATLIASNITFGTQLLEAMVFHGVTRFVNTGTYWEHYENKDYSPVNLYAATKYAFQNILQYYTEAKGINAITLKLFDPYGPNDPRPKLLNFLKKIAESGEFLAMSPGEQKIDLVHVDDVTMAYEIAANRLLIGKVDVHEVYGVASGQAVTLKELVIIIERQTGERINIEWGGRDYKNREVMLPWSGSSHLIGWKCKISLEKGLSYLWGKK